MIRLLLCVSIYHQLDEPDVTNEQMTHPLKLHKFLHIHDAEIMTHYVSQTRTTQRVDLASDEYAVRFHLLFGPTSLASLPLGVTFCMHDTKR